jgi:hypothetical protein
MQELNGPAGWTYIHRKILDNGAILMYNANQYKKEIISMRKSLLVAGIMSLVISAETMQGMYDFTYADDPMNFKGKTDFSVSHVLNASAGMSSAFDRFLVANGVHNCYMCSGRSEKNAMTNIYTPFLEFGSDSCKEYDMNGTIETAFVHGAKAFADLPKFFEERKKLFDVRICCGNSGGTNFGQGWAFGTYEDFAGRVKQAAGGDGIVLLAAVCIDEKKRCRSSYFIIIDTQNKYAKLDFPDLLMQDPLINATMASIFTVSAAEALRYAWEHRENPVQYIEEIKKYRAPKK